MNCIRNSMVHRLSVAAIVGLFAIPAGADVIYTNDLGTVVQQNALRIVNLRSATTWTLAYENGITTPYPYTDLDGDGLVNNAVVTSGWESSFLYKDFYAPVFQTYSAPEISALGSAASSYSTNVGVQIGKTGAATYSKSKTAATVSASSPELLQVSAGADPDYQRIKQFQAALYLTAASGASNPPDAARRPRAGDMSVSAIVNDAQVGDNVYIYKNDFGTQSQINQFTLAGAAVTTTSAPTTDNDLDNLGGRLAGDTESTFNITLTRRIDAPEGTVFSDPVFTALAYGNAGNWASWVTIALSVDGVNFEDVSATTGTGPSTFALVADSSGNGAFDSLTTVWAQITLHAGNNGTTARPWIENVLVSATITAVPEPGALSLLAMGGVLLLRRRRAIQVR